MVNNIEILLSAYAIIKGKKLLWLTEISNCVTFTNRNNIYITACLKEILLRNNIPLTYANIEKIKYELIVFIKKANTGSLSLRRTSEIFLSKEDKKFLPIYNDAYCSHFFIDGEIWLEYANQI